MQSPTSTSLLIGFGVFFVCGAVGCATPDPVPTDRESGGNGSAEGGQSVGSGGAGTEKGGATGSGGATSNGGATGNAGATTNGGSTGSGGATASSGGASTAKGGATGSGGRTTTSSGGSQTTGPSGTQLFLDDFEDGDYTAPPDMSWILADMNGMWSVATQDSSKALTVEGSSKALAVSGNIAWTDQKVSAKVKVVAGTSTVVSLMGRWAAEKSYIVLEYRVGTTSTPKGDLKLRRNADGSTADICRYKPPSALPGEWHKIGFAVKGGANSTPVIYFDDQAVTAETPCVLDASASTAGGIAVGVQSGTAAFDDVTVVVP